MVAAISGSLTAWSGVGGQPALSLHSSNEPGKLSQRLCRDNSTININSVIIIVILLLLIICNECVPRDRYRLLDWMRAPRPLSCSEYKEDRNILVSAARTPVSLLFTGSVECWPFV